MNELFPIADMALALYDEETSSLHDIFGEEGENEDLCNRMERCFEKKLVSWTNEASWNYFPLNVDINEENYCAGVLAVMPCTSWCARKRQITGRADCKLSCCCVA